MAGWLRVKNEEKLERIAYDENIVISSLDCSFIVLMILIAPRGELFLNCRTFVFQY